MGVVLLNLQKKSGENVLERLQESLKMAETGVISNCIVVMTGHDGTVVDCWANGTSPFTMVGALETVKREFMDQIIEYRREK